MANAMPSMYALRHGAEHTAIFRYGRHVKNN